MSATKKRQVIVHYHIFKNAGSTVDHILKNNYGSAWATFDGEKANSKISPQQLEAFIRSNPLAKAISSHNAILPLPKMPDITIAPIVFLRHPLDRIRSIYDFERHQGLTSGPISMGAEHAAKLSFDDYIKWRFETSKNGVIHNYHTAWLLHLPRFNQHEIQQKDFELALETLGDFPFFGLVERFDDSLALLSTYLGGLGMSIKADYLMMNASKHSVKTLEERLSYLHESTSENTWKEIVARNQWDIKLYEAAQKEFQFRFNRQEQRCISS